MGQEVRGPLCGVTADTVSLRLEDRDERMHFSPAGRVCSSDQRKEDTRGRSGGVPGFPGWWETPVKSSEGRDKILKAPDLEMGQLSLKKRFLVVQTGLELVM